MPHSKGAAFFGVQAFRLHRYVSMRAIGLSYGKACRLPIARSFSSASVQFWRTGQESPSIKMSFDFNSEPSLDYGRIRGKHAGENKSHPTRLFALFWGIYSSSGLRIKLVAMVAMHLPRSWLSVLQLFWTQASRSCVLSDTKLQFHFLGSTQGRLERRGLFSF